MKYQVYHRGAGTNGIAEALTEILSKNPNNNVVIGTHSTALSTILHYYDPSCGCEGFKRIWDRMFCL